MKHFLLLSIAVATLPGCVATGNGDSPLNKIGLGMTELTNSIKQAITPESTEQKFSNELHRGKIQEALTLAAEEAEFDEQKDVLNDQLWGMQTASLYRLTADYEKSNLYFDHIEDVMYQEDTESVLQTAGETALSTFTNDTFLDYEQTMYDSIMVNTYKAINFMAIGDVKNARVEWNRSDDRQRRAAEFFAEKINEKKEQQRQDAEKELKEQDLESGPDIDKSISRSQEVLAKQGIDMSQWSAYDGYINPFSTFMHGLFFMLNAQDKSDLSKGIDSLKRVKDITHTSVASQTLDLANQLLAGKQSLNSLNKVWVIFENSEMAKKEEFRVDLPLFLVSDDVNYAGIALPKLSERPDNFQNLEVNETKTEVIADMDKIIKAEFKEEFSLILTREITRTIVKTVLQKQLGDEKSALGVAGGLVQALTTEADTRTWSMLPKNFQAAVLNAPKDHKITISSQGLAQPIVVDVAADKNTIIYVKAVNSSMAPSVEVLSI